MKNKKPNFFIVGAPKCGTTALASYLNEHSKIYVSNPKEPHYFATDFPKYRLYDNLKQYLDIFNDAKSENTAIGEASVFYMYSKEAIKQIHDFDSNAKIIVMIRNPIEMVYSFHSQLFYTADENVEDFSEAWKLEEKRRNNFNIPKQCREPKLLYYSEIAKYGEQLDNIYTYFPRSQVKIILFDDFKKDVLTVYKDVLSFLNIEYDNKVKFEKVNENKKIKYKKLNQLTAQPPLFVGKLVKTIKNLFGIEKFGIIDSIRKNNTIIGKRDELSQELKETIYNNYKDDINKLSLLLNRDLSFWKIK